MKFGNLRALKLNKQTKKPPASPKERVFKQNMRASGESLIVGLKAKGFEVQGFLLQRFRVRV